MANPSSTSSKRLVGLGLRGIRNSPPTQMTAQFKSVLCRRNSSVSPRTSPTALSSPSSSPKHVVTNKNMNSFTITPTTSIANAAMKIISPNPKLRSQGDAAGLGSPAGVAPGQEGSTPAKMAMTATTTAIANSSSPLIESFTPSGLDAITSTPTISQDQAGALKGAMRSAAAVATSDVNGAGAVKTKISTMQYQSRGRLDKDGGDLGCISPSPSTVYHPSLGLGLDLSGGERIDSITPEGFFSDDVGNSGHLDQYNHRHNCSAGIRVNTELEQSQSEVPPRVNASQTPAPQNDQNASQNLGRGLQKSRLASTSISPHQQHPFVDVPFPLHPEKTFRIHTSPLAGGPLLAVNPNITTTALSDVAPSPPSSGPSFVTSSLPTSASCPFLSTSSRTHSVVSPKLSSAFSGSKELLSKLRGLASPASLSSWTTRESRGGVKIIDDDDEESPISPNTRRRMYTPINENMYKSPPQGSPSPILLSSSRSPSPSSVMLLSSRVHWLRQSEKDEVEGVGSKDRDREQNYSTMCSPSSSPFLPALPGRGTSVSPSPRRSGYGSPVAKIETVLGPRERGIECVPEKRDYQCSYSRLRMSPGTLTPLAEDESFDFDVVGSDKKPLEPFGTELQNSDIVHLEGLSLSETTIDGGGPNDISGLPVSSSSGKSGFDHTLHGFGQGSRTAAPTHVGLRRKITGIGSPLAKCVATWESVEGPERSLWNNGEGGHWDHDADDVEMPTSPLLMRAKDSLLLTEVQRRKKKREGVTAVEQRGSQLLDEPVASISVSTSAPPRTCFGWRFSPDKDSKAEPETQSFLTSPSSPSSPGPFRSPSQSTPPLPDFQPLSPVTLATQIRLPDTPTIGPCTRTTSGSKDLDEAISPLQLSSPTFPFPAAMKDSAWAQAPLVPPVTFDSGVLRGAPTCA